MTDESAFQESLNADPDNHFLREVFADYLEEQGDPRSLGYRWMGENRKRPYRHYSHRDWSWWNLGNDEYSHTEDLPSDIEEKYFNAMKGDKSDNNSHTAFPTRALAETAFCHAFAAIAAAEAELEQVQRELAERERTGKDQVECSWGGTCCCRSHDLIRRERSLVAICGERTVPA